MTFGSLFAGIGGLDLGLERAGMECRWQVEIDPFCQQVLKKHWPKVPKYGDITKLTGEELESVQLICGGFPCQDLSQAGKRTGIEGNRSGLWFEFARIVGMARPQYVLIENVPGLLVRDAMRRVVGELARLGYVGWWRSLRASEFGASHLRKRVFIVAHCASGGFGELRQSPGSDGLVDRRDTELEDAPRDEQPRFPREGRGMRRRRVREAGEQLADGQHQGRIVSGEAYDGDGHHASGNHTDGCDPIVAHTGFTGNWWPTEPAGLDRRRPSGNDSGTGRTLADAGHRLFSQPGRQPDGRDGPGSGSTELADTKCAGLEIGNGEREQPLRQNAEPVAPGLPAFAPGPADPRWPAILAARPDLAPALANPHSRRPTANNQHHGRNGTEGEIRKPARTSIGGDAGGGSAPPEPALCGVADGLPGDLDGAMRDRTKRLGRLGNAVVPQVAEWIGRRILEIEADA